ncbi:MAG: alkaline phosphatase family protein [Cyclobacteriaceae bacterium]|nr:alkaline phosphatase family protein [Cyclobacteriaceae bacterium]MCH8515647.1 alkaline phosphatase family protein [Cyclobacteriaceae bacterium]
MHRFRSLLFLLLILSTAVVQAQERPKLVVGIVVDQMRADYLYKFDPFLGEDGFKRLVREGFEVKNFHYDYIPTYTGPGHASIFTGTGPYRNGVVANNWYDRALGRDVYCAEDTDVSGVGGSGRAGKMSPKNNKAPTIGDEMRLHSNFRSKSIGVSIKDRGAIMPAGHSGNAYWFDKANGNFITSTYYMETLPDWVAKFNEDRLVHQLLASTWETVFPIEEYEALIGPDNSPYEHIYGGREKPTFPYDLEKLKEDNNPYDMITTTPFGNTLVTQMGIAALKNEKLGQDEHTDLLSISYSSPDIIGHIFGTTSVELLDNYVRLDREIADLLKALDEEVGEGNYTVFLTADHAAAYVPQYLLDNNIPAGYFDFSKQGPQLSEKLNKKYGEGDWVTKLKNEQIYLNRELIEEKGVDLGQMQRDIANWAMEMDGIARAYAAVDIHNHAENGDNEISLLKRGLYPKRSGDVLVIYDPNWMYQLSIATTHGSGYKYDTHVPMYWMGAGIPKGKKTYQYYSIPDIAPTISFLLNAPIPSAASGKPILQLFE